MTSFPLHPLHTPGVARARQGTETREPQKGGGRRRRDVFRPFRVPGALRRFPPGRLGIESPQGSMVFPNRPSARARPVASLSCHIPGLPLPLSRPKRASPRVPGRELASAPGFQKATTSSRFASPRALPRAARGPHGPPRTPHSAPPPFSPRRCGVGARRRVGLPAGGAGLGFR